MHSSDVSLEGAEEQRRQTRELDVSVQASAASGDRARAEADEAQRRALEAHEVRLTLELQLDARKRAAQHARMDGEVGECHSRGWWWRGGISWGPATLAVH